MRSALRVADFSDGSVLFRPLAYLFALTTNGLTAIYLRKLNDARYRISTIDGEMSQIVQESDFPKASVQFSMPDITDISMLVENVWRPAAPMPPFVKKW